MTAEEPFEDEAMVEALYAQMPDGDLLSKLAGHEVRVIILPDADWIKLSQEGLPPVRAGRFFVYGAHDAGMVPHGVIPMRIEAGMAFGTGHHETTALCLAVLSDLAKRRRFTNVLDMGCGTGLLAIGAAKLWRRRVIASDIDPEAVAVARENALVNGEAPLIRAVVADGLTHPAIAKAAPFDLIVANILAGPLTQLAPAIVPRTGARRHVGTVRPAALAGKSCCRILPPARPRSCAGFGATGRGRRWCWNALVLRDGALRAPPQDEAYFPHPEHVEG